MVPYLIVGLGNPGNEYQNTRHNIGWSLIEKLPFYIELNWKKKLKGFFSIYECDGKKFYFLMPQTYMNLSGESVISFLNYFKIEKKNLLVLHDELELDFGTVAYKRGGGLAGHNGLKSIASALGDNNFDRFRLGIGRPAYGSVSDWVLGQYDEEEKVLLEVYLEKSVESLLLFMKEGSENVFKKYNKKKLIS